MAEQFEMEYFCQAAKNVASQAQGSKAIKGGSSVLAKKISGSALLNNGEAARNARLTGGGGTLGKEDFVGLGSNPEEQKEDDGENSVDEVDRLREENKRLKKTLLEKFKGEEDQ